ncbi:MAG TPA: ComEC/Rec2 family competence protein, partial [Sphingobacteriaceae bacterium]
MFFKGKIPFVRLLLALVPGIISAKIFHFPTTTTGIMTLALGVVAMFTIIFYRTLKLYKFQWIPGVLLHILIFFLGFHLTLINDPRNSELYFAKFQKDALIITVSNEPRLSNGTVRFEGNVKYVLFKKERRFATGKLLVAFKVDSLKKTSVAYGDLLLIPSEIKDIQGPLNPGEFDYRNFLSNKQIYHQIFTQYESVHKLQAETGNRLISYALALRKQAVAYFNCFITDPEAAAIASTLILGYRADLSTDIIEAYSRTGTMHVLSVSGMHVGLVFLVLNQLLKKLDRGKELRFLKPSLIILLIWFYALITGFSPSVCRAAMMLSFYVLGKALNRSQNSYNLIAISAFCLLIYNPYFLFDVGFQLSYLAVLGLVYIHPKIYHLLHIKNRFVDQVWNYSALSVAAQLATFSLSIYYFHQFPVYFLISNLFIVPPVTLIMYL